MPVSVPFSGENATLAPEPIVSVPPNMLNDKVLPFYAEHDLPVLRILTDRGTEYCGRKDMHDFQLFPAINDIDHTRTKARHPQTSGICERFHKTILQEIYQGKEIWKEKFIDRT